MTNADLHHRTIIFSEGEHHALRRTNVPGMPAATGFLASLPAGDAADAITTIKPIDIAVLPKAIEGGAVQVVARGEAPEADPVPSGSPLARRTLAPAIIPADQLTQPRGQDAFSAEDA